jgi:hypothetical protein
MNVPIASNAPNRVLEEYRALVHCRLGYGLASPAAGSTLFGDISAIDCANWPDIAILVHARR